MGSRSRRREPNKVRRVTRGSAISPASTSGASADGEGLGGMISAIHEKFRKKAREQKERAELRVKNTIASAMQAIGQHVLQYEEQIDERMTRLRQDLLKLDEERDAQAVLMKARYSDFKEEMQRMFKQLESMDTKHRERVRSFFASSKALSGEIKEAVKATASAAAVTPPATVHATPGSTAVVPKAGTFVERLRMLHHNE